ncbi:MAG TPA: peptide ABC transporter substrate-binding protein [Thermomicrobiales bacterium]|nr:peptide ABC transporter substrate-binding protein [Thermomicrobiales bacterium]
MDKYFSSRGGATRVLLLLLMASTLLAGVPIGVTAQDTAAPFILEAQDEPNRASPSGEQTLRLSGQSEGPDSLDPAFSRDLASAFLVRQIFRGLTRFGPDLEPVPELAQRIEVSTDGLDYTFDLRPNATFQNGTPITADVVVFSLTRALEPATAGGDVTLLGGPTFLSDIDGAGDVISGQTEQLRGVEAVDEDTVHIRLSGPHSTFLMKLASAPASIVDPEDVGTGDEWWRTPNGSGPFHVSEWEPDDHMILTRFDDFVAGPATLSRIEIRLGANSLQPFNLYEAGQIDVTGVDVSAIDRVLAPESGLSDQVTVTPLFAVDYIAFRSDTPPFDDPAIRRAVQLGFPRAKLADVTYDGFVSAATGLIPNGMLGRDWPAQVPGYDLPAARKAIAESSYGSAEKVPPIRIYVSGYAGASALRDTVQRDLGLKVEIVNVDWSEFVLGLSRRDYPAYELYWGADYPDPESLLLVLFGSDRADNYVDYHNDAFDDLLRQSAAELDLAKRSDLYSQAQQVLLDDQVVIPLYFDVAYTLAKPAVRGLEVTPLGILGLESVWLEH